MRYFPPYWFFAAVCLCLAVVPGCQLRRLARPASAKIVLSRDIARQGVSALEQGRYDEAESKLAQAISLNNRAEDLSDIRFHYAEALWQRGKQQESLSQLLDLAKQRDDKPAVQISLASKLLVLGEPEAALQCATRSLRFVPQDYKCWVLRARAAKMLADQRTAKNETEPALLLYKRALADYHRSVALAGQNPAANREILPELAMLQRILGQNEQELATWQALAQFYPADQPPRELLAKKAEMLYSLNGSDGW